jgi:hypothetical protein
MSENKEYPQRYVDALNAEIRSLKEQLDLLELANGTFRGFESAALAAGEAIDIALKQIIGPVGCVDVLAHPEIVDRMHQALNRVVAAANGIPWRKPER